MHDAVTEPVREPARITIGTDPSGMPRRPDPKRRGGSPQRPPSAGATPPPSGDRNLPVAVASGLVLAAVFLALAMWRPAGAVAFVTVALGLASIEYFTKVTEKGYRPAVAAGVAACVAAPLAAYWVGDSSLPLVITFAFMAGALGFIGANSIEVGPMPNMAITMLGVVWIGVLGSFAALILRWSTFGSGTPWGTDTLVLIAIGVVANDVGRLLRRVGVRPHAAAPVDQPEQVDRGIPRWHDRHARRDARDRHARPQRHLDRAPATC